MKTLLATAALAFLAAAPAAAQDLPTITVETGDLDLSTPDGIDRLEARIKRDARVACRNGDRTLAGQIAQNECRTSLIEAASPQVELAIAANRQKRLAALALNPEA